MQCKNTQKRVGNLRRVALEIRRVDLVDEHTHQSQYRRAQTRH